MEYIYTSTQEQHVWLLEVLWKVMKALIDTHTKKAGNFHGILRGFCVGRGMGIATIEMNLSHEMVSVDQDPLLLVFLELRKAYCIM